MLRGRKEEKHRSEQSTPTDTVPQNPTQKSAMEKKRGGRRERFVRALLSRARSVLNSIAATEEEARSSLAESLTHFPRQMS